MKSLPTLACLLGAALLAWLGVGWLLEPPGFAQSRVLSRDIPSSISVGIRAPNPDARLVKLMPAAESVVGTPRLEPGYTYLAKVRFTDRRYDPTGFKSSDAKGAARLVVASKAAAQPVKVDRSGRLARDGAHLTYSIGTFRVAKAEAYALYAECDDTRDVVEMARFELWRVSPAVAYGAAGAALLLAVALAAGGALMRN